MQVAVDPRHDKASPTGALLDATLAAIDDSGGGEVDWWVFQASSAIELRRRHAAASRSNRDLRQMRRPLPTGAPVDGRDPRVRHRARRGLRGSRSTTERFSGHAEQGGWTIETLRLRMAQPWFDPDGFRLHERDGRLAAFCWTKIHHETDRCRRDLRDRRRSRLPGSRARQELTLAGLDRMVDRGVSRAMLYVDGANRAAVRAVRAPRIRGPSHRSCIPAPQ